MPASQDNPRAGGAQRPQHQGLTLAYALRLLLSMVEDGLDV